MKKIFLTGLICAVLTGFSSLAGFCAAADNTEKRYENPQAIKNSIDYYKKGNYLACISTLNEYTQKDPYSPIAWYYLGSAYMHIAMVDEATQAFDKVIALSKVPKLTSYSIQAQLCMKDSKNCKYTNFSPAEIKKLKEDPVGFLNEYYAALEAGRIKSDDVIQIENLINGSYAAGIHPDAQDFILNQRAVIKASQINSGKS